jgi:hypothetical protein
MPIRLQGSKASAKAAHSGPAGYEPVGRGGLPPQTLSPSVAPVLQKPGADADGFNGSPQDEAEARSEAVRRLEATGEALFWRTRLHDTPIAPISADSTERGPRDQQPRRQPNSRQDPNSRTVIAVAGLSRSPRGPALPRRRLSVAKPRSHSVRLCDRGVMIQWGYARSLWLEARSANQCTQFSCSEVSTASGLYSNRTQATAFAGGTPARTAIHANTVPVRPVPPRQPTSTSSPRRARMNAASIIRAADSASSGRPKSSHSIRSAGQLGCHRASR